MTLVKLERTSQGDAVTATLPRDISNYVELKHVGSSTRK